MKKLFGFTSLAAAGSVALLAMSLNAAPLAAETVTLDERQPPWPVPTTSLAGGAERKTGLPVWSAAPPA
ncbi:hypothetical protein [Sulfitobacter sp. M13]